MTYRSTLLFLAAFLSVTAPESHAADRPNILWILGDDLGTQLGCYGDPLVKTPNIDRLASQGIRFTNAHTTGPVCSASRSALITGYYQTTIGAHNHRSHRKDGYKLPDGIKPITDLFREAGYFTANVKTADGMGNGKTDFNFNVDHPVYDGTDWSRRKPGQPFFAMVNFMEPHRGPAWPQARKQIAKEEQIDPSKVKLPPYYPDTPLARDDWANYLDAVQLLDGKVGRVLKRLEDEKLTENTVVFFFGDNGRCHVRDKQWVYDGGTHVPLIVRLPGARPSSAGLGARASSPASVSSGTVSTAEKPAEDGRAPKPGEDARAPAVRDDLLVGIDFSATSLKLAGIDPPKGMQGHVFLGEGAAPPRSFIVTARDRCDETDDRIRCVRTKEFSYIRNFFPERPYTQPNAYKERQYPVLQELKDLFKAGKLTPEQSLFMASKRPAEELYDLKADPHEVHNLSGKQEFEAVRREMAGTLDRWIKETNDQGEHAEDPKARNP